MDEPQTIRAGDSVSWTCTLPAYPASDGWTLHYKLLWPAGTAVEIATTAAGDDHQVSLASGDTDGYTAGAATLVSWVTKAAEKITLEQQAITILPDLTAATTFDGRSDNEKALAAAKAALKSYMEKGQIHVAEYDIAGRRMKFRSSSEITDLIAYYERQVFDERVRNALAEGKASGGRVFYKG